MAFALRLFLLLLLAVALPARAAQAAPWRVQGASWDRDMGNLEKLVYDSSKILEHGEGDAGWKNEDVGDKKSLEAAKLLDKMLGDLERRRVMKGKIVLKAEFPGGSSGSAVAASATGGEAMPVTGGEHSRKASPAAWLHEDLQPLEPPAGVSVSRTFQGTLLVAPHKPGSHHRGLLRGRNKLKGDSKFLETSKDMDKMLSDLERRREMEGEAVLKTEFPRGSSGSLAASAAGREAMSGTVRGGEHSRKASPAAGMEDGLEPMGTSAGMSARRTFQGPLLDAAHRPRSHHRGHLRGRNKPKGDNKFLEASKHMDKTLSDLERRREIDQKALRKAALPGTRREEMPDSATEDVITETGIYAQDPVRLPRIVCPQDVRRSCMIGTVVTIFTAPVVLVCCYFGIRKLYEMRRLIKPTLV
ncbi:uncharacterized protein LOC130261953 [Oenanthe melanoleuca]|uniref:uncharacterized protein LOC130261953 n=1 Tax=Oenanthe melanoleuca TaxID=2939378 RepID=UPI0024C158EE|nr:uncharacterized protein LOC130261953 [Oenanthe melanoleuca]